MPLLNDRRLTQPERPPMGRFASLHLRELHESYADARLTAKFCATPQRPWAVLRTTTGAFETTSMEDTRIRGLSRTIEWITDGSD